MPEIEKYSIKLDRDGGIHPGDIPAGKLAELLAVLSKMFADKTDDFCLSAMEDNCVRLDFNYSSPLVKATIIAFSAFLSGQTRSLPLRVFRRFRTCLLLPGQV